MAVTKADRLALSGAFFFLLSVLGSRLVRVQELTPCRLAVHHLAANPAFRIPLSRRFYDLLALIQNVDIFPLEARDGRYEVNAAMVVFSVVAFDELIHPFTSFFQRAKALFWIAPTLIKGFPIV